MIYTGIGSRETPDDVLLQMKAIAMRLGTVGDVLRSGCAPGADSVFEDGAREVDGLMELFLPWPGFEGHELYEEGVALSRPQYEAYAIAGKFHPAWHNLSKGARALHARNVHQILGPDVTNPVLTNMVICWTKDGKGGGGTGQALRIAKHYDIKIYDLALTGSRDNILDYLEGLCSETPRP